MENFTIITFGELYRKTMRFHQPLGVVANNNNDYISVSINETNPDSQFIITSDQLAKINPCHVISNVTESVNLTQLKSIVIDKRNENFNNFDSSLDSHKTTTLDNILKFKSQSKYFRSYLQSQETDTKSIDSGNGNNGIIFIETLNFIEDNLTELATLSPTSPTYDNCITNQSYNVQKCLSSFQRQRRENLIKLDLESNYMTKHEGLMQMGVNSAGCSVESSPVDSLLDDQELLSPSSSSCADLSSPDPNDLQQHRRYPRGIINPNYPGFQHLAHTLAEHFIDHHQLELSDSEISEDFDFDAAYRSGNLGNVNIMGDINDSNNNNDNINNNADALDKNIDLNRNKNRRSSFSKPRNVVNDLSIMKENQMLMDKGYEDGNDNLLMKSEPKVFCESKHLDLHQENENHLEMSDGEDEECCNVSSNISFKVEIDSSRMDFDEDDDELADLSGEDDAAIKNELENIDKADNDFNENINCDLATYLTQYDFKMDLNKTYKYENEHKTEEECLTDEDNSKLPTPDILIEHNNKKLQNDDNSEDNMNESNLPAVVVVGDESKSEMVDVSQSDDVNDYQPDLIKNITETININDNNEDEGKLEIRRNVKELHENEKGDNERNIIDNGNDEKIINQMQQTETASNSDSNEITIRKNHPLSFESATSTTVDIIGDFGKEIEKEIGLIVSGYRNATNEKFCEELSNEKKAQQSIRPIKDVEFSSKEQELVFDENKFIEHLKYFSKMGDAALSSVEETITMKSTLVDMNDQNVSNMNQFSNDAGDGESLIPTAIVKPKYQKLSFDDRQLPICGSTDDTSWHSQANTLSTTITTTPRKVQKHLPKSQKSFAKQQNRKVVNKGGDLCVDYEMSGDKESINSLRHNQKETDCGVAIVQPIKKIIDANASVNMNDEKNQKSIDISKNRNIMSHKHEQRNRNSTKCEIAVGMNECGDKNINFPSRKSACIVRDCEKKVPTKKKDPKEISDAFDVYNIETALPVIDMEAIETHLMAAKEEEQK
ncbi:CLUMA_CG014390, isoform A, partial [Clunio marinus]